MKNIAVIVALRRLASRRLRSRFWAVASGCRLERGLESPTWIRSIWWRTTPTTLGPEGCSPPAHSVADNGGRGGRARLRDNHHGRSDSSVWHIQRSGPAGVGGDGGATSVTPPPGQLVLFADDEADGGSGPGLDVFLQRRKGGWGQTRRSRSIGQGGAADCLPASRITPCARALHAVRHPDGDAEHAGVAFIKRAPTFIFRDALEARRSGGEGEIVASPQRHEEAQQTLAGLNVVQEELTAAIMQQPEVPQQRGRRRTRPRGS